MCGTAQTPTLLINMERDLGASGRHLPSVWPPPKKERRALPSGRSSWGTATADPRNSAHFIAHPAAPEAPPNNKASSSGTLAQTETGIPRFLWQRMSKEAQCGHSHLLPHHFICHFILDSPAENKVGRNNRKGPKTNSRRFWEWPSASINQAAQMTWGECWSQAFY